MIVKLVREIPRTYVVIDNIGCIRFSITATNLILQRYKCWKLKYLGKLGSGTKSIYFDTLENATSFAKGEANFLEEYRKRSTNFVLPHLYSTLAEIRLGETK